MEPAHTILHRIATDRVNVEPSSDGLLVRWHGVVDEDLYLSPDQVGSLEVASTVTSGQPTLTISYTLDGGRVRTTREITAWGAWNVAVTIRAWADKWRAERAVTEWLDRIGDLVGVTPVRIDTIDTVITASGDDVFIAARVRDVDAPPYTYTCRRGRTTIHSGPNAFAVEHLDELVAFVGAGGHDPTRLEATLREWLGPRTVDLTGYVKDVTITFTPTEPTDTEPLEDCAMFVSRWHVVTPDQSWDDLLDDIAELPCDHTVHIGATDLYRLVRAAVQRVDE